MQTLLERVGLWTPYLGQKDCEQLTKYKYHSGAGTKLDNVLNRFWWTPLSEVVPKTIHPNVLTVVALLCSLVVSYLPLLVCVPDFESPAPRIVYGSIALGFFAYQTLDAIDGKQARRTGLSSPTGQMMDHGCDSLTTYYSMFIICATVQLGQGSMMCWMVTVLALQLYMYQWWECTFGVFRSCTGEYCGVTEGQFMIIFLALVGFIRPEAWGNPAGDLIGGVLGSVLNIATLNIPLSMFVYVGGCGALYWTLYKDVRALFTTDKPKDVKKAVREWAQIALQVYANVALIMGGVVARHPFLSTMIMANAGSLLAWRLILSSVAKAELRILEWPSYPYIATSILCSLRFMPNWLETIVLLATFVWTTAALLSFIGLNMTMVRDHLGTRLFTVPVSEEVKNQSGLGSEVKEAWATPHLKMDEGVMATPDTCETSPVVTM